MGREERNLQPTCFLPAAPSRVNTISPRSKGECRETRELNLAPSTSRISKQLPPDPQPLLSPLPRNSRQPGPQVGYLLIAPSPPPHCKVPKVLLPRHDRCSFYSVFSSQDKSTKPTGMQTGLTSIEATCWGPSLPHPSACMHAHTHARTRTHTFFKALKHVLTQ